MDLKIENKYAVQFLLALETEKNFSSHTVKNYETDLVMFFDYLKDSFPDICVTEINKKHIRGYLAFLHRKKYKVSTIKRKVACIRSFFNYLMKKDILQKNCCLEVSLPKSEKNIPSWIGIDDMFVFLDSIKTDSWSSARNRAMFEFMYSTGVRVSELVALNIDDIDFSGYAKIIGKGNKERLVPVGEKSLFYIKSYLDFFLHDPEIDIKFGPLFLNRYKKRISDRSIRRILDKLIKEAGLYLNVSPHKIRHSFATHMLDNGADLRFIQEFLNHKSLSTTQKYTHVTMDRLMEVYDKSHPRH